MDRIFSALVLGFSAERLLVCPFFNPFVAFGLTLTDRFAGLKFLLGKLLGLVIFGIIFGLIGYSLRIDIKIVNLVFGILATSLGAGIIWRKKGDSHSEKRRIEGKVGFGLGLIRGMLNPGRKYIYLVPLLLGAGPLKGALISFAYGLSSSIFLFMALVSAAALQKIIPYKHTMKIIGGLILMFIGVFYIYIAAKGLLR